MGFNNMKRTVSNLNYAAADAASVHSARVEIFKLKKEMIRTPLLKEIVNSVFGDSGYIPRRIILNSSGIIARVYDHNTRTYHPNGVTVYQPDVSFDYVIGCALLSTFQDIYPNVYNFPNQNSTQLAEDLDNGTWSVTLEMKDEYVNKAVTPSFDINNIDNIPDEKLPVQFNDPNIAKNKVLSTVSLVLGAIAFLIALISLKAFVFYFLSVPFIAIGIILGIIGFNMGGKKLHAGLGILLSVLAFILPIAVPVLKFIFRLFF